MRRHLTRDELRALVPTVRIVTVRAVTMAGVLLVCGCSHLLGPKATLGPGSIVRGRGLYNEVIAQTNNEQTLELIVRARYGEPIGLLSVVSMTANLRASTTLGTQVGFGPSANYQGNIVPLSAAVAFEQNPTISYVPVQGERFAKSIGQDMASRLVVLHLRERRAEQVQLPLLADPHQHAPGGGRSGDYPHAHDPGGEVRTARPPGHSHCLVPPPARLQCCAATCLKVG